MTDCIGYVRCAAPRQQGEDDPLSAQVEQITARCRQVGLNLVQIFRDERGSGFTPMSQRPAGSAMLQCLQ